jgi:hypothetical protein
MHEWYKKTISNQECEQDKGQPEQERKEIAENGPDFDELFFRPAPQISKEPEVHEKKVQSPLVFGECSTKNKKNSQRYEYIYRWLYEFFHHLFFT